jgi:2-oxoglutarate ferredoxin oxidoreductase subunit delta
MPEEGSEKAVTAAVASPEKKSKRRKRQGRVTIFPNWCKGCGLCVEFCPTGVLKQTESGRVVAENQELCTACRWCELHCPDFAIFVTEVDPEEEE